jgi:hypothetical protein
MIKPIKSLSVEVVPQAVLALPVQMVLRGRAPISEGIDDLDYFEGASFKLDNNIEIAVRHYRGHPANTSTIYIDRRENELLKITSLIRKILTEFEVPLDALKWERKDDPDL